MKKLIIVLLLSATSCFGQSAQVIKLPDDLAAKAKALYEQRDKIEDEIIHLRADISKDYTTKWVKDKQDPQVAFGSPIKGWPSPEFEFSSDFKYIVPVEYVTKTSYSTVPLYGTQDLIIPNLQVNNALGYH